MFAGKPLLAAALGKRTFERILFAGRQVWPVDESAGWDWADTFDGDLHPRWEVTYGSRKYPHLTGNVHVETGVGTDHFDLGYRFQHVQGDAGTANTFMLGGDNSPTTMAVAMYNNGGVAISEVDLSPGAEPSFDVFMDQQIAGTDFTLQVRGRHFAVVVDDRQIAYGVAAEGFTLEKFSVQAWYDSTLEMVRFREVDPGTPMTPSWVQAFGYGEDGTFTSLPRWEMADLPDMLQLLGPPVSDGPFELGWSADDPTGHVLGAASETGQAVIIGFDPGMGGWVLFVGELSGETDPQVVPFQPSAFPVLRRAGGQWQAVADGQVLAILPDDLAGQQMRTYFQMAGASGIPERIWYTEN